MNERRSLEELLAADALDPGCAAAVRILEQYVELELAGEDPERRFPGIAAHLRSCDACRADRDGLLDAARHFSDEPPVDE